MKTKGWDERNRNWGAWGVGVCREKERQRQGEGQRRGGETETSHGDAREGEMCGKERQRTGP